MRWMADTTDHSAPSGYDLYAGYIDGSYRSFDSLSRQYPGKTIPITVLGDPAAKIADVETGDITPAHAPGWVKRKGRDHFCLWVANYSTSRNPVPGAMAWQRQDHGPHGENIDVSEVYDDGWPYDEIAPTIYCPSSWVPSVVGFCSQAGLLFAAAGTVNVHRPPEAIDVLQLIVLAVPQPGPGYEVLWSLPSNKLIPIPDPMDAGSLAGVPVWTVDQAFVDAIKSV